MKVALSTSSTVGVEKEGLATYLSNLISGLQEVDGENDYYIFMPRLHARLFQIQGKNFHIIWSRSFTNRPIWNVLWHFFVYPILLGYYRIDLVHIPDFRRFPLVKTCRLLLTIHDVVNFKADARLTWWKSPYYWALRYFFLRYADVISTVSENSRNDIIRLFQVPADRVHVTPNGVSAAFQRRDRCEAIRILERYRPPVPSILCVSRLEHPRKNHVTLLQAFRLAKERYRIPHKLLLIGKRWDGHEVIFDTIKELNLDHEVIYYGYTPPEDLPYFYNIADFLVYPSLYEGFGLPPLEAMASGLPVIASKSSSMPEVVGTAGLLFNYLDPEELADRIGVLANSEDLRLKLIQEGLVRASRSSCDFTARSTLALYKSLGDLPSSNH